MKELEKILEEIDVEFDRRIDIQLKIMARLNDDVCRYGYGKSLEAYQQGKLFVEDIIRKHMNDGWIPVEDKLPEDGTEVIVTDRSGQVWGDLIYGYPDEADTEMCFHKWDNEYWQCYKPDVIAWQPLPEPYRPERSEGE